MQRFQQNRHALGSSVYLTIVLEDGEPVTPIFDMLWRHIDEFENRFSRFLEDSELSTFNAAAGTKQNISPEFRKLLIAAKGMAKKSNGLYNPCTLPALQRAGYKGSWPEPHKFNDTLVYEDRSIVDWRDIHIGNTEAMIPGDAALDFGGIGKGYLLDELAQVLDKHTINSYWLSLGGDILCNGYDANGDSWRVGIQDARSENKTVGSIKNKGQRIAIATSGVTKRQGISGNGQWHHIIDPRTGKPAQTDSLTTTVCSKSATIADVTAKCLIIVGSAATEQVLSPMNVTEALLQRNDNTTIKIGTIWQP